MRIYNYDPEDKFFLNEREADIDPITKTFMLPAYATFVAPPTNWPKGTIPVFNGTNWDIVEDKFWRPEYEEVNYYSGKDTCGIPQLPKIDMSLFTFFPPIPRMMNPTLFGIRFANRIEIINIYVRNVFKKHQSFISNHVAISPLELLAYKTEIEIIIYLIKKSIDDLITLHYIKLFIEDIKKRHRLEIQGIGKLLVCKQNKCIKLVRKSISFDKYQRFLVTINDVHNSFKHDLFISETDILIGKTLPTVCAISTQRGNFNKVKVHNHFLGQLIISFSDFLIDNLINFCGSVVL